MMKNSSILFFLVLLFNGFLGAGAQDKPSVPLNEKGEVVYSEVVQHTGVSGDMLFKRLDGWFNRYFVNTSSVIQEKSEEKGTITGQHSINIYTDPDTKKLRKGLVKYMIDVQVKDGRYKYTINDIFLLQSPKLYVHEWLNENDENHKKNYVYLNQVDQFITELVDDLKSAMSTPLTEEKEDNW